MVVRANKYDANIGGHLATYASAATLFEVGFNHFFRIGIPTEPACRPAISFISRSHPPVFPRAFLEARLTASREPSGMNCAMSQASRPLRIRG